MLHDKVKFEVKNFHIGGFMTYKIGTWYACFAFFYHQHEMTVCHCDNKLYFSAEEAI